MKKWQLVYRFDNRRTVEALSVEERYNSAQEIQSTTKAQSPANKVFAIGDWNTKGVLLMPFLSKGSTMRGEYYATYLTE